VIWNQKQGHNLCRRITKQFTIWSFII